MYKKWIRFNLIFLAIQAFLSLTLNSAPRRTTLVKDPNDQAQLQDSSGFDGWAISYELFNFILKNLKPGSTILELGSGWGSGQLSKFYTLYSIEHDEGWMGKYNTNYIYAPIQNGWYNVKVLEEQLPKEYDLILVDGPTGKIGRGGFFDHIYLFNVKGLIVFDDVNRLAEHRLMLQVAELLERPYKIYFAGKKNFGVIFPS